MGRCRPTTTKSGRLSCQHRRGAGQREGGWPRGTRPANAPRTQRRSERAKCAGSCAPSRTAGQGRAVHCALAPRQPGSPAGGLRGAEPEGRGGRGWRDVAGLRSGPGGQPPGSAPAGPARGVPGEAVSQELHLEGGRAAAATRYRRAGGQDRPARRRRGAQQRLRGRLPRLLLWIPCRAQPASRVGCARSRDPEEAGELGARRGHPRLLGAIVTLPTRSWGWWRRGWFRLVGPVFAGLCGVRCGRGGLAARCA